MQLKKYKTKQRDIILDFLNNNQNVHITAEKLFEQLKSKGSCIGLTTIYRTLNKLVDDGVILKYTFKDGVSCCYQYVGDHTQCSCHYHLLCDICNKIEHIYSNKMDDFCDFIESNNGFKVNKLKTVVYGTCKNCS